MTLKSISNRLSRFLGARYLRRVPNYQTFIEIIRREIARVDRTGGVFSLVCFRIDDEINAAKERRIIRAVSQRIRSTDYIGRMKEFGIGAVLFGSNEEGARELATSVCLEIASHMPPPYYIVYTYPNHWFPNSGKPIEGEDENKEPLAVAAALEERDGIDEFTLNLEKSLFNPIPHWKRALDIAFSSVGIAVLAPVFLLISAYIKVVSRGPVFFKQERMGHLGRPFQCYKFRTMKLDSDVVSHHQYSKDFINNDKPMIKLDADNDPRIIPLGELLRHSGLDELPQLLNIFKGDMSLIGPRPCLGYEAAQYHLWHTRRFDVIPGITGLWQVEGKNRTTFNEMICHDINYARKKSIMMDIRIMFRTIPAILADLGDLLTAKKEKKIEKTH